MRRLPPRRVIELMASFAPSMFAGHSVLGPYNCKGKARVRVESKSSHNWPGGLDAPKDRWHPRIVFVCERRGSLHPVLRGNFWVSRDQELRRARLRDGRRRTPCATAVQEGSFEGDHVATRWGW